MGNTSNPSVLKNMMMFILVLVIMILYALWQAAPLLAYILLAWVLWKIFAKILKPILRMVRNGFKAAVDGVKEGIEESKQFFVYPPPTVRGKKIDSDDFNTHLDDVFDQKTSK